MKRALVAIALIAVSISAVDARGRFICGATAKRLTGSTCGSNLALAWAHNCQHTTLHAGAVAVFRRKGRALGGSPGGHVALIESVIDGCHAFVHDERGRYERDVCKNLVAFVTP